MKKIAAIGFTLLMVLAVFVPVVSALNDPTKEGYQSVVNPNPAGEKSPENAGYLYVQLACRSPQIGGEFTAVPVIVSATFTNAARVDKGFVDQFVKVVGTPTKYQYRPDGLFDMKAEPGTYLLTQLDGNGGQPEYALVTIKAACKETVVFLGHGITPADEPKDEALPEIKVLTATYGMTKLVYIPCVPAVTHQETVVDHAAYDEQVLVTAAYDEQVLVTPAVAPHYEHVSDPCTHYDAGSPAVYRVGTPCSKYTNGHVHANEVGGTADGQNRFVVVDHGVTKVYEINNGNGGDTFTVTGTYTAAVAPHYEHVSDPCTHYDAGSPAVYETVHHDAVYNTVHHDAVTHTVTVVDTPAVPASFHLEGSFKNVKTQVQAAVDAGERTLKFDNAQNPGGLFDGDNNLLAAINDPAPGQVKKFVITYKINGHIKVKAGNEYEVFTLE